MCLSTCYSLTFLCYTDIFYEDKVRTGGQMNSSELKIAEVLGEGVNFSHNAITRGGVTRHTITLSDVIDEGSERPVVVSGLTLELAAAKAKEKVAKRLESTA